MDYKEITCSVLVVGAGPAGGSAAYEAASRGLDVVILEKRGEVGIPVQCAEYIPCQLSLEVDLPKSLFVQKVEGMLTHMPDGKIVTTKTPGFIVNRDEFDKYLVKRAIERGAILFLETRAVSFDKGVVLAKHRDTLLYITPKIIIGADGPLSTVGSWIGSANHEFIQAVQYLVPLKERTVYTQVYFSKESPGGYAWIFPKRDVANVGLGVNPKLGIKPKTALDSFINRLVTEGVIGRDILKRTRGLIPSGGLIKLYRDNIILSGDAGGFTHPITGAGIASAVLSGKLAGGFAWQAIKEDDIKLLAEYETECRELFFDTFVIAKEKKTILEEYWQRGEDDLSRALRWSWIAFEEYHSERVA